MKLYVGNLPYSVTEEELSSIFAQFGEVVSTNLISDRETGRPKGFGFVEMGSEDGGQQAIGQLDNTDLKGRSIRVSVARPREARPPRF